MSTATTIKLRPLFSWLLVQPRHLVSETTKTGLVKVNLSDEKPQTGVVLAVGPDIGPDSPIQPGTLVLYGKFVGTEVDLGDYEALLLDVKDLLSVVELIEAEVEDEPPAFGGTEPSPLIEVATR